MPTTNRITATTNSNNGPLRQTTNAASGSAASEPTVPGATGDRPQPNQVESQTDGCEKGSGRRVIVSERQAQRRHRLRGDALAAAGEAEAFGGRRFDADALRIEAEDFGDARDHRGAMRTDLRALADQRHVDMRDA